MTNVNSGIMMLSVRESGFFQSKKIIENDDLSFKYHQAPLILALKRIPL